MSQLSPKAKKRVFLVAKLLVVALVAWFIRATLLEAWGDLRQGDWSLHAGWLALSAAFYLAGLLPAAWFWHRTLHALGQRTHLGETLRAYCIGHLGKYVPGKAMVVILRAGLVRSQRVHTGVAAASVFFETLTMMASGAILAAGVVAWRIAHRQIELPEGLDPRLLLLVTLAMGVASALPTMPPVFRRLVRVLGVGRGDPEMPEKLRGLGCGTVLLGWLAMTLSWLLLGASLWATFRAMGLERLELVPQWADYTAVVALAVVAGFVSMIPAGFGVRDLLLMALAESFFAISAGAATVATALLRVVWLVAELIISGILYVALRREGQPVAETVRPSPD